MLIALSNKEKCLFMCTTILLITCICMALCVGLILPDYIKDGCENRHYHSSQCLKCADCQNNDTDKRTIMTQRYMAPNLIHDYPFVISISLPAYEDAEGEWLFACTGFVVEKNWALAGKNCVHDDEEWAIARIRSKSTFWSVHGQTHKVIGKKFILNNYSVLLRVESAFDHELKAKLWVETKIPIAYLIGWNRILNEKNRRMRLKFENFDVEKWEIHDLNGTENPDSLEFYTGKPLISACGHLLGLQIRTNTNSMRIDYLLDIRRDLHYFFTFYTTGKIMDKIQNLQYKKLVKSKDNIVHPCPFD